MFKSFLYFLIILTLFSCKNEDIYSELTKAYITSSKRENDTLSISKFKILSIENVDYNYAINIRVNTLETFIQTNKRILKNDRKVIALLNRNIEIRNQTIKLNPKKRGEYLIDIENLKNSIEKTKINITEIENEIAKFSQQVVLLKAESNVKENVLKLVHYVFEGSINSKNTIDTLHFIINRNKKYNFIKDGILKNYKGK